MTLLASRPEAETPRPGRFSLEQKQAAAGCLLLLLSWLTTEHFLPWVIWHSEALTFAGLVAIALAGALAGRARVLPIPVFVLVALVLPAVAALQWLAGSLTYGGDVVVLAFYGLLMAMALSLGALAARPGSDRDRTVLPDALAWTFVVGSALSVVISLLQVFELGMTSAWVARMVELRRPGANFLQPNQLATLHAWALAALGYLYQRGRLSGRLAAILAAYAAFGIAVTESRTGLLATILLALWWNALRPRLAPQAPRAAAWLLVVGLLLVLLLWPRLLNVAIVLPEEAAVRVDGEGLLRITLWREMLAASFAHPWLGWGVLEVPEAHNSVVHLATVSNPLTYSHNLVLDLAVWAGWPLAALATIVTGAWLLRRLREAGSPADWFTLAVVLALGLHSMLEYPFAYAYFLVPCLLLVGWMEGARARPARAVLVPRRVLAAGVAAWAAVLLWSAIEYLRIEEDFRVVRFQALRMGTPPAGHEMPEAILFTQLGELLSGSRITLRPGMPEAELAALRRLALRHPWVVTQYRYLAALALNGQIAEAERQIAVLRAQRGKKTYEGTKHALLEMAKTYPQLRQVHLP